MSRAPLIPLGADAQRRAGDVDAPPAVAARPVLRAARRRLRLVVAVCVVGLVPAAPAHAAYPTWSAPAAGTAPTLYQGTLTFTALGFPSSATYSIALDGPTTISVTTRLTDGTSNNNIVAAGPWGSAFGATEAGDGLYVQQATSAANTTVKTTIDFPTPLAPGNWGLAIGDIDVERVVVGGLDAASTPLTGAQLQGSVPDASLPFNQTTGAFSSSVTWDASTRTLIGSSGSSARAAWLQPSTTLSRFTVDQCQKTGTPPVCKADSGSNSLRIWVGVQVHTITATVTHAAGGAAAEGATVQLIGPTGTVLASSVIGASGSYAFPAAYAQPGYRVRVTAPTGFSVSGTDETVVNLTADTTVAFQVARTPEPDTPAVATAVTPTPVTPATPARESGADDTAAIGRTRKRTPTQVATPVDTTGAGTVTQHGTARWDGGDARTVCRSQRVVRRAAEITLVCRLNTQARLALGRQALQLRLVTVFTARDGTRTRKVQTLTLARFTPSTTAVTG